MKNFGEFYDDQISHASCILLSRTQTASDEQIAAAVAMLREKNPTATIVTTADILSLRRRVMLLYRDIYTELGLSLIHI